MKKSLQTAAVLSVAALGLAACGSGDNTSTASSSDDTVKVVTTTDVYADIVKQVAGDTVEVTSIIDSTSQDPHSYEATSQDRLAVQDADVVVLNGGGYDAFMEDLAGSDNPDQKVINAVEVSDLFSEEEMTELTEGHSHDEGSEEEHNHDHGELNEHVWYSLDAMEKLADQVATSLGEVSSNNKDQYVQAADDFGAQLDGLIADAESVGAEGKHYVATEPVPGYLLQTAGFEDSTPADLTSAVESGNDLAPLTLQEIKDSLKNGETDFLAYNEQTSTAQTDEILKAAQENDVPNTSFTETLPEGEDYVSWMQTNIDNIKNAVA